MCQWSGSTYILSQMYSSKTEKLSRKITTLRSAIYLKNASSKCNGVNVTRYYPPLVMWHIMCVFTEVLVC